jgi:hypothetical protein
VGLIAIPDPITLNVSLAVRLYKKSMIIKKRKKHKKKPT